MNEEPIPAPSQDEARATLAAIETMRTETRRNIAGSEYGPNLIWCGLQWIAVLTYVQFAPPGHAYLLWLLAAAFFVAFAVMKKLRPPTVKPAPNWRVGALWVIVLIYAGIFWSLLEPWEVVKSLPMADSAMLARKFSAYAIIFSFLGTVIMGLWVNRFFVGLGLLMTALILVGYYWMPGLFFLWMGVVGGSTFILSGIFIRKFWK